MIYCPCVEFSEKPECLLELPPKVITSTSVKIYDTYVQNYTLNHLRFPIRVCPLLNKLSINCQSVGPLILCLLVLPAGRGSGSLAL